MNLHDDERMNELFRKWRARYSSHPGQFIKDGVIGSNESCWSDSKTRVLVIVKDCNDPEDKQCGNDHDLRELLRNPQKYPWNNKSMLFAYNIGRWAYGIRNCSKHNAAAFCDADDPDNRRNALHCSAVVNLKKIAGCAKAKTSELRQCVRDDGKFLREQLEILNPEVVICGGTVEFVNLLIPGLNLPKYSAQRFAGRVWMSCMHPSARSDARELYEQVVWMYQKSLA